MRDLQLVSEMLKAQGSYVNSRVPKSERVVFTSTMQTLINMSETSTDINSFENQMRTFAQDNTVKRFILFRLFSNPAPIRKLAINVAQDIVDSVKVRFVDGGSKVFIGLLEERLARSIAVSQQGERDAKKDKNGSVGKSTVKTAE
jgi:hypothetical protein